MSLAYYETRGHMVFARQRTRCLHQGVRSLEIWSHAEVDAYAMMRAATHALGLPPRHE